MEPPDYLFVTQYSVVRERTGPHFNDMFAVPLEKCDCSWREKSWLLSLAFFDSVVNWIRMRHTMVL
jgi:hypothetical protein